MAIVYPVSRLLAQPKLFNAIASYLGGPDPELLREAFMEMLEHYFGELPAEECEFEAEEATFEFEEESAVFTISFDSGISYQLQPTAGENHCNITTNQELSAAFAIHRRLVLAIEESYPELKDDVSLESPPTPGNSFLASQDGESFEGTFHLRSNPDAKYAFNVLILDGEADEMKASIKPM